MREKHDFCKIIGCVWVHRLLPPKQVKATRKQDLVASCGFSISWRKSTSRETEMEMGVTYENCVWVACNGHHQIGQGPAGVHDDPQSHLKPGEILAVKPDTLAIVCAWHHAGRWMLLQTQQRRDCRRERHERENTMRKCLSTSTTPIEKSNDFARKKLSEFH